MNVALDIDDTITRCPGFFALLSKALNDSGHKVYIITYREDRELAEEELAELGITYHDIVLATEQELEDAEFFQWKADVCRRLKIDIFFEDMPEVVNALDDSTIAFVPFDPELGKIAYVGG